MQVTPKGRPPVTGRLLEHYRLLISQNPGKGVALRKEKAFLHTFVAGQKHGVGRDVYGLPPYCKGFVSNNRDRIAAVYPASLWSALLLRA